MKRALGCMNFMTRRELLSSAGAAAVYAAMPRLLKGQSTAAAINTLSAASYTSVSPGRPLLSLIQLLL